MANSAQLPLDLGGTIELAANVPPMIDGAEALARLARFREAERRTKGLPPDPKDAPHGVPGEMLSVSELGKGSYLAGRVPEPSSFAHDPLKSAALMQSISTNFARMGAEYHFRDQPGKVAFTDGGERLDTKINDGRIVAAMVDMAEAKGWPTINVTGSKAFKQAAWLEASVRGIDVKGFSPTTTDLRQLAELKGTHVDSPKASPAVTATPSNSIERAARSVVVKPPTSNALPAKDVEESLTAAKTLLAQTLGEGAKMYSAETDSGRYTGAIIGETNAHFVQQLSPRSAVAHQKHHFADARYSVGDKVAIAYSNGAATLKPNVERATTDKQKGR
jgi:hypothetical protein